ncbi:MAG: cytochrome c3 family protein [Nitrospirae bacterium]|nr:cytochrome c3 family protein [Nitrospirota bacterium]
MYIPILVLLMTFFIPYVSILSAQEKITLIDANASCVTASCHSNMGKKKYVHAAGVDARFCVKCHEIVKDGEHTFRKISSNTRTLCIQCHGEGIKAPAELKDPPPRIVFEDKNMQFHPLFIAGECTACHDAHESNFYKHLKVQYPDEFYALYTEKTYALCININCHKGFEKALTAPRTLTDTMFRNGNVNLHYSHVSIPKGRTCRTCHQICYPQHVSKNPKLIRESFPFGKRALTLTFEKTETGGDCSTTCHRTSKYDRYEPVFNLIKTVPPPGNDATDEELKLSRERDLQKQEDKEGTKEDNKQ